MTTYVINREDCQKPVQIRDTATGKTETIFVQPLSKAKIPDGSEVPAEFLKLNPKIQIRTA